MDVAYAMEKAETLARKFEAWDVQADPNLGTAASRLLYSDLLPQTDFIQSVRAAEARYGSITAGQAKGILNIAIAAVRKAQKEAEAGKTPEQAHGLLPGFYTVVFDQSNPDDYVTLKIKVVENGGLKGKTIVSYLSGSDNENSYTGFAFLNRSNYSVWKKYTGMLARQVEALNLLLGFNTEERFVTREAYALRSSNCSNCGRTLTVPASIHRGLGPDCAARLGVA